MKKYLKFVFILLVIIIILISISCKNNKSEINKPEIISSSETKEETFLTYSGDEFPKPIGYVNDYANIVDKSYEEKISSEINKVKDKTDADVVVITIDSLEGKSVEDYTSELFNTWEVSRYGVILLISFNDKKLRISTGYDMEKAITNDNAKSIIDDVIVPKFRESNYNEGIYQGVKKISEYILAYGPYTTESSVKQT
jgi:uncharacterized protein